MLPYLLIALPRFSLRLKFGIKRILILFEEVFAKEKGNSSPNASDFNKFSC